MAKERTIPNKQTTDLTSFEVKLDGNKLKDTYVVVSISTCKEINRVPSARLILKDGDASKEDFEISSGPDFKPGAKIEISAGYQSKDELIFKGIIVKHGINVRSGKPPELAIECRDEAVKMTVGRKNGIFYEVKDSEVIEDIAGTYGLSTEVESTKVKHNEMVQYYATDWDFVVTRAECNGLVVIPDDGKLIVKKPDPSPKPAFSIAYGATVVEFEGEIDARTQYAAIKASSWDPSSQDLASSDGADPGITPPGNMKGSDLAAVVDLKNFELQHSGIINDQELQAWADACYLKSSLAGHRGRVKFQGYSKIKPGETIGLEGLGTRFNGTAYVSGVKHIIQNGNWLTDVQFGLSPSWFKSEPEVIDAPASGVIPAVSGLQLGTVTQIGEDPDGENRILVKVPMASAEEDGLWARFASPDAGPDRGVFFMPEIGDEVVLGFLNDDPRNPVVLGTLHSSVNAPPLTPDDENNEKGIVTRSAMKLMFDDDKKVINIETPGGNKVTISDDEEKIIFEDMGGSKIELSADGILFESSADLILKASGDIKLEGTNIEQAASAEFKAEGSAGAEVSTGATAILKGSMVQIN